MSFPHKRCYLKKNIPFTEVKHLGNLGTYILTLVPHAPLTYVSLLYNDKLSLDITVVVCHGPVDHTLTDRITVECGLPV